MRASISAKGIISFVSIILILIPSLNGAGSSSWIDNGEDFNAGICSQTDVSDGTIKLDMNMGMSGNWTKMSDGSPMASLDGYQVPSARMVYDKAEGVPVLFDYWASWLYNSSSRSWSRKNLTYFDKYWNYISTYVSAYDLILLRNFNGQTWTYDPGTDLWAKMNYSYEFYLPVGMGQSMTFDEYSDKVILWGGSQCNETWTYDLGNDSWTRMFPSVSPPERTGCSLVFDPILGETVLFGGRLENTTTHSFTFYNDTWTYNLTNNNWTKKNPSTSPPPLSDYTVVYDEGAGVSVVFGGATSNSGVYQTMDQTWWYNASKDRWTNKTPLRSPQPRFVHAAAYDSHNGVTVLFGGKNDTARFGDTWTYDSAQNGWTNRFSLVLPRGRAEHSMIYEEYDGCVVMFGGSSSGGWGGGDTLTSWLGATPNDLWFYNSTTNVWTNRRSTYGPPRRDYPAMVYASGQETIFLFGGEVWGNHDYVLFNDTWSYDLSTGTWTNLSPPDSPCGRYRHKMAYDKVNNVVVLFGGNDTERDFGDTWIFDFSKNNWIRLSNQSGPSPDSWHSMAFDMANGLTYLASSVDDSLWTYDARTNSWVNESSFPPDFYFSAWMDYDSGNDTLVMSNGFSLMQFYSPVNHSWKSGAWPEWPMDAYGFCYDRSSDTIALFGGYWRGGSASATSYNTWVYNLHRFRDYGTFDSRQFDTGGSTFFGELGWNATIPDGTSTAFQFRSGSTQFGLNLTPFTGPDGTNTSVYTASGQRINSNHNGSRWIQYRAFLRTDDTTVTPVLDSVTIGYNLMQELRLTSPAGGEYWSGIQNITWSASDPDNDSLTFSIYLENAIDSVLLASDLPNKTSARSWNTSAIPNGTYRIRISADDDNPSIPLTVNATSGNFTIYHPPPPPPPNRLPHIALLSPLNNSVVNTTTVCLTWIGTDPDGDELTYTVRYSDRPLDTGNARSNATSAIHLDLLNLSDNTIYYWTVDASDGTNNHTDMPADIWTFTVRLPIINNPPRITSLPKTTITAGETYTYNLTAIDEDFNVLRYSLVAGPPNISIDDVTGRLRWPTALSDVGNHTVTVQVSDTAGATVNQTFTVQVLEIPHLPIPPACKIASPANNSKVPARVVIRGTALNGSLPLTIVQIRIDNGPWQTAVGLGNWSISVDFPKSASGRHRIEARAFDGSLYSDTTTIQITIQRPASDVTTEPFPVYIIVILVVIVLGLGAYLLSRNRFK